MDPEEQEKIDKAIEKAFLRMAREEALAPAREQAEAALVNFLSQYIEVISWPNIFGIMREVAITADNTKADRVIQVVVDKIDDKNIASYDQKTEDVSLDTTGVVDAIGKVADILGMGFLFDTISEMALADGYDETANAASVIAIVVEEMED